MERCRREIAEIESLIRAGHPEIEGLCLALLDWSAELRLIEEESRSRGATGSEDRSRRTRKAVQHAMHGRGDRGLLWSQQAHHRAPEEGGEVRSGHGTRTSEGLD